MAIRQEQRVDAPHPEEEVKTGAETVETPIAEAPTVKEAPMEEVKKPVRKAPVRKKR